MTCCCYRWVRPWVGCSLLACWTGWQVGVEGAYHVDDGAPRAEADDAPVVVARGVDAVHDGVGRGREEDRGAVTEGHLESALEGVEAVEHGAGVVDQVAVVAPAVYDDEVLDVVEGVALGACGQLRERADGDVGDGHVHLFVGACLLDLEEGGLRDALLGHRGLVDLDEHRAGGCVVVAVGGAVVGG